MSDVRSTPGHDEGFTLTELMVVLILLGIILGAIWSAAYAMSHAGSVNEKQSVFSKESGESVRIIEKHLMQLTRLEGAGPDTILFTTDVNLDGLLERMAITANSARQLRYEVWQCDAHQVSQEKLIDTVFSTHVANVALGVPLFTYLDKGRQQVSLSDPDILKKTRSIRFHMVLESEGQQLTIDRVIYLRNQSD